MINFNFYRVGEQWAVRITTTQGQNAESKVSLFPPEITDDDITKIAIVLAKSDSITTNVNFKGE